MAEELAAPAAASALGGAGGARGAGGLGHRPCVDGLGVGDCGALDGLGAESTGFCVRCAGAVARRSLLA